MGKTKELAAGHQANMSAGHLSASRISQEGLLELIAILIMQKAECTNLMIGKSTTLASDTACRASVAPHWTPISV